MGQVFYSQLLYNMMKWRVGPKLLLLVGILTKFYESANGRLRMQKGDIQTFSALTRCFVDKTTALLFYLSKSVSYTILNSKSYVLNTSTTTIISDKFCNRTILGGGLKVQVWFDLP